MSVSNSASCLASVVHVRNAPEVKIAARQDLVCVKEYLQQGDAAAYPVLAPGLASKIEEQKDEWRSKW